MTLYEEGDEAAAIGASDAIRGAEMSADEDLGRLDPPKFRDRRQARLPAAPPTASGATGDAGASDASETPDSRGDPETAGDSTSSTNRARSDARDRGTALHRLFEAVEWLDDFHASDDELNRLLAAEVPHSSLEWRKRTIAEFRQLLADPADSPVARLLLRTTRPPDTIVLNERPFVGIVESDGGATLTQGRIDRMEIEPGTGTVRIIDWKTDRPTSAAAGGPGPARSAWARKQGEHHRPQLERYVEVIRGEFGEMARIEILIVLTEIAEVVELSLD